ncbi:MAG: MBL fold metallo-hydrolase [Salinivirgaceae bacterium]|nr:MBL fold metallo-hydrolase [Salinivirgaceae bacterium]
MQYKTFVFSPFQENTYVLFDESNECIVIDAGNFFPKENEQLDTFFKDHNLKFTHILNTHNHLDHIFGSRYLVDKYGVKVACHEKELPWIDNFKSTCQGYGLNIEADAPKPEILLSDGEIFKFGTTELKVILVPGHSAGGLAFYNEKEGLLFCGDILFQGSIGRTDLPGGNHELLISGIKEKLLILPDETKVFSGHGAETTIGEEKRNNPFLK